jgi:hypothetical protein
MFAKSMFKQKTKSSIEFLNNDSKMTTRKTLDLIQSESLSSNGSGQSFADLSVVG